MPIASWEKKIKREGIIEKNVNLKLVIVEKKKELPVLVTIHFIKISKSQNSRLSLLGSKKSREVKRQNKTK